MNAARSAREVVELYNNVVWNEQRFDLADELLGDEVIRHGVNEVTVLSHAEAVQRIRDAFTDYVSMHFTLLSVVADTDGEHVAIVYQCDMVGRVGGTDHIASIEVFQVVGGRIVAVYNNAHQRGIWR